MEQETVHKKQVEMAQVAVPLQCASSPGHVQIVDHIPKHFAVVWKHNHLTHFLLASISL